MMRYLDSPLRFGKDRSLNFRSPKKQPAMEYYEENPLIFETESLKRSNDEHMRKLNATVKSRSFIAGKKNGYKIPVNDNALLLIALTTQWKELGDIQDVNVVLRRLGIKISSRQREKIRYVVAKKRLNKLDSFVPIFIE